MSPIRLFFFHLYLSISDAVVKGYEFVGNTIANIINKCLCKSISYEESLESLDIVNMNSSRVFIKSD